MDIFNKKKVSKLEAANEILRKDNRQLLDEIDELKNVIKNKGYFFPDVKHLMFRDRSQLLVDTHFNCVINSMNAYNIEIVDTKIDSNGFDIYYKMPPTLDSADFSFNVKRNENTANSEFVYSTNFKFMEKE